MKKPNDYDNVSAGDFTPVQLGGHYCVIKQLKETTSKAGKPMVIVYLDFDKDDVQPGYMSDAFKGDIRPEKKWPYNGTKWILTEDADGKCSRSFKKFITAFEKSNNCTVSWGDKFEAQFKNKRIGAIYGEVESEYDGKVRVKHEIRYFCSIDKVSTANVPEFLPLSGGSVTPAAADGFLNVPADQVEDLPF